MRWNFIKRISPWIGWLIFWGLWAADRIDKLKSVLDAPSSTRDILEWVSQMFSDLTPLGITILAMGTVCLIIATVDWWRPFSTLIADHFAAARKAKGALVGNSLSPNVSAKVPLLEAANQLYEQTLHTAVSDHAEGFARNDPDGILRWCAQMILLDENVRCWACKEPARIPQPIPDEDWEIQNRSGQFVIRGGGFTYVDVTVLAGDLKAMIARNVTVYGPTSVNLDEWDRKNQFTLWEAAWLWAGQEPRPQSTKRPLPVTKAFRELEKAIEDRILDVIRDDRRQVIYDASDRARYGLTKKADPRWRVNREDLIACAHSLGKKPAFLFPRERT